MLSSRSRLLLFVAGFTAVVQQVHEEREVFQEERALGLHQVAAVRFFRLERKTLEQGRDGVHASLVEITSQTCHIARSGRSNLSIKMNEKTLTIEMDL